MLVDAPAALGGDGDEDTGVVIRGTERHRGIVLRGHMVAALARYDRAISLTLRRVVSDRIGQLIQGELLAAVFTEQPDRVSTALATVTHQIGAAGAGILKG